MEKELKNIDDLLRSTLSDFEKTPTEGVKQRIMSSLRGGGLLGILTSKILWVVLGLTVIVTMIFFYNYKSNKTTTNLDPTEQPELQIRNQETKQERGSKENLIPSSSKDKNGIEARHRIINSETIVKKDKTSILSKKEEATILQNESLITAQIVTKDFKENPLLKKEPYLLTGYYPFLMKSTFDEQLLAGNAEVMIPLNIKSRNNSLALNLPGSNPTTPDDYGKEHHLLYGLNIVPELIFQGSEKSNKGIGLELTGRYLLNDFYLESGLGVNISDDDGLYQIDYEQYDSIGYYYKVNSFTIDEITGKPVFNTDLQSVYDTVDYSTSEATQNRYTYLYLPLYAGVKVYEFRRLSLNLQAGIIYSIMIGQHEPEATYTNDNATRIYISNENPARISSNWLMTGSLGISYQITPCIYLNLEPMVRYYFKPVYERQFGSKTTFGTGLRVGLYFKF